jgi:hypothetical protein
VHGTNLVVEVCKVLATAKNVLDLHWCESPRECERRRGRVIPEVACREHVVACQWGDRV